MKKTLLISLLFGVAASAFAQVQDQDPLDRDRSKYATYSFSKDDQYTVETPYETVSVKQPKGKKVKNVIFMIGAIAGLVVYFYTDEKETAKWILAISCVFKFVELALRILKI